MSGIAHSAVDFEWRLDSHLGCLGSIINARCMIDHGVALMKRGGQSRQCAIPGDLAEVTLGFEHTCGDPAQDHGSALPAFDPPRNLADPAEQVFDQVGRGQYPVQRLG